MNPRVGRVVYLSPWWGKLVRRHATARAIYVHEIAEIAALLDGGCTDPEELPRDSITWLRAHARACLAEADYWSRWAAEELESIPAEAFLLGHPQRSARELRVVVALLEEAGLAFRRPSALELQLAMSFYQRKESVG